MSDDEYQAFDTVLARYYIHTPRVKQKWRCGYGYVYRTPYENEDNTFTLLVKLYGETWIAECWPDDILAVTTFRRNEPPAHRSCDRCGSEPARYFVHLQRRDSPIICELCKYGRRSHEP